jgi:3-deoxy-D-manno-octulosonic-acid transferase
MRSFWFFFYNIVVVPVLWLLFHLAALVKRKVRVGLRGRKGLFNNLQQQVNSLTGRRCLWFHASSLGEFEQAKPVIGTLRRRYSHLDIVVSFFSPSGYEHSRNYRLANVITYLPFDSRRNARRFVELVKPTAGVFVRYDVWPNHLWELQRRGIPSFIANATMSEGSSRRRAMLKSFHRTLYNSLHSILAVSEEDAQGYRSLHLSHPRLEVIGDTRYDQVWMRSQEARGKRLIPESIVRGKKILVVGSSWEGDERIILPAFSKMLSVEPDFLLVIVPHEPNEENLERIESELDRLCSKGHELSLRFSGLNDYRNQRVIIVDSVGILLALYAYAAVAYVGGGFLGKPGNGGVHNVLEPAVYGVPVLYGPNHDNSQEAVALVKRGGGFVVTDEKELYRRLRIFLEDDAARCEAGRHSSDFVEQNIGATERVIKYLEPYIS